ncbi:MAG: hypothetical protein U0836_23490 [Pirellulales bacterium]
MRSQWRPTWTDWLGAVVCLATLVAFVLSIHYGIDDTYYEWGLLNHND